jgi:23S rRNA (adenine2030-N6)-methyltransferase
MNYRHTYHAGNFADVLKHAVLALVIEHLKLKPAPFRFIDTHAGCGVYDLSSAEAAKTGEWKDGIGRIFGTNLPTSIAGILAPYLSVITEENPGGQILRYPGSPLVARRLMRSGDALVANELHPEDGAELKQLFARDSQAKVLALDGWTALKSLLPPKERRGIVLIDPPFEEANEYVRLTEGLANAARRFATGTVMLWFPIKDERAVARFYRGLRELAFVKLCLVELRVCAPSASGGLSACGLVILNPPYTLPAALAELAPFLASRLARGKGAASRFEWLSSDAVTSL